MSARSIGRGYGVVIACNSCGATTQTANIDKKVNRAHAATLGWARGACPAVRTRKATKKRAEVIGSMSTRAHDLCPSCIPADRERASAIEADKQARKAAKRAAAGGAA